MSKYGLTAGKHMPIEIPNTNRETLAELFNELVFLRGVEIGTERGLYAEMLCHHNPLLELFCVDPWEAYKGYREHVSQEKLDGFYEETRSRLLPKYNVKLVRKYSMDAAKDFEDGSLDFVFIDGNHSLPFVMDDICAWTPKVRKGGIVAGHDYIKRKSPEYLMHVVQSIHAYTDAYQISPWFVLGSKAVVEGQLRDHSRTWFFVR